MEAAISNLRLGAIDSDPHNFGRRTQLKRAGGDILFEKPRTVYWEWLFFGVDSPLRPILFEGTDLELKQGATSRRISDSIFQLRIPDPSHSSLVHSLTESPESPVDWFQFGGLLAYSWMMGIGDLHSTNVLRTEKGLVPIDVECVFAPLRSPSQTLLIPFRETASHLCGLAKLCDLRKRRLSAEDFQDLMGGVIWTWRSITNQKGAFLKCLEAERPNLRTQPIRIILKPTRSYVSALDSSSFSDFIFAEKRQLERGDVPYFFSTFGSEKVFYYDDPSLTAWTETELPREIGQSSDVLALAPLALTERWNDKILAEGLLTLAWKLGDLRESFGAESNSVKLQYADQKLLLTGTLGAYSTPFLK